MKKLLAGVVLSLCAGLVQPVSASGCVPLQPGTWPSTVQPVEFNGDRGLMAIPEEPSALVVMFHGYRNTSASWACHIANAAERGAAAFALDYRGTGYTGPAADNRGWFVREGAQDSIGLAQQILAAHPSIRTVIAFGISMGSNASGYAVAAGASKPGGGPLFDHWITVEGALNVPETYAGARVLAPGNAYAAGAVADIEAACAARSESLAACFADLSVVARADDVKASGLRGAVVVHGLADGLVPYDQSAEMTAAMRALGIPVHLTTVLTKGADQPGTTAPSYLLGPAGHADKDPFAGHGWEGSETHAVIATGFRALWRVLGGATPTDTNDVVL